MPPGERNLMLIFLTLAVGTTALAFGFHREEARLFPLVAGTTTAVIILLYFVATAVPLLRQRLRPYLEDETFRRLAAAQQVDERPEGRVVPSQAPPPVTYRTLRRRELVIFASLAGFGLLSWLVGVTVAAPVFLFAVMTFYCRESLRLTVLVTGGTTAFLYLIFVVVLRLPPHLGLLGQLL